MRKLLLFFIAAVFFSAVFFCAACFPAAAQSLSPQVVASGGGVLTGSNGVLTFTIGETAVGSFRSGDGVLTQGFSPVIVASNPLPLDFLSFTAGLTGGKTLLQWTTTHEINTDYFEVQRSFDGANFVRISTVPATDPTDPTAVTNYQAIDSLPLPGTDYYRLREVDQGGQVNFSPIVAVKIGGGVSYMVYPNPLVDEVHVRINCSHDVQATIALYDVSGRLVYAMPVSVVVGENEFVLNLAGRASGVYMIRVLGIDGLPTVEVLKK